MKQINLPFLQDCTVTVRNLSKERILVIYEPDSIENSEKNHKSKETSSPMSKN